MPNQRPSKNMCLAFKFVEIYFQNFVFVQKNYIFIFVAKLILVMNNIEFGDNIILFLNTKCQKMWVLTILKYRPVY